MADPQKKSPARRPTDKGLEAIRGIAMTFVALSHVLYLDLLTPDLNFPRWLRSIEGGHAGVLVFFVLSGYVIGWTNSRTFSREAARDYLRRRLIRLAPIYLLAVAITTAVMWVTGLWAPLRVIVGSVFCLQNFNGYFGFSLNPPLVNNPLWSLNYEILYYGLFLILWRFEPASKWVFGPALLAATLSWFAPRVMPLFIGSYAAGWLFWAAGWWLSRRPQLDRSMAARAPIATWVLLIFASHQISGATRILNALGLYSNDAGMVSIGDLGILPGLLLLVSALGGRQLTGKRWIELLAWTICVLPLAGIICTGRLLNNPAWLTGLLAVLMAGGLRAFSSERWLRPFAWLGGISYAFYVLHFPLLYLVQDMPIPRTTVEGFLVRLFIWIGLILGLSWLLERRFQPWIKARILVGRRPGF